MTRPNCSLTRNHSSIDQPWPPYSGANRPPFSRAAIASRLMCSTVSSGSCPPSSSASSSSGISTVSTNVRARCWSSSWSDVSSWPAVVGKTAVLMFAPRFSWRAAARAAACLSRFAARRDPAAPAAGCGGWRSRRSRRSRACATSGSASPRPALDQLDDAVQVAVPAPLAPAQDQSLDPRGLLGDRLVGRLAAAERASRPRPEARARARA